MLAVVASRIRHEEKAILDALERRGVAHVHVDPRSISTSLERPSFPFRLALNRELAQTRGLYAAHLLEAAGVAVVNSARASELCADKIRTTLELARAGIAVPATRVALTTAAARVAADELGFPLVVKPVNGSWGRMVSLIRDRDALTAVLEHRDAMPSPQQHIVYLQQFIDKPERDVRVLVVGGRPIGAIYRRSSEWRTNVARGAECVAATLDPVMTQLARDACSCLGVDFGGVDLVEDRTGKLYVLEVNHVVEFRGFALAHPNIDVGNAFVDDLLARMS